jgi:hypothetical protein
MVSDTIREIILLKNFELEFEQTLADDNAK